MRTLFALALLAGCNIDQTIFGSPGDKNAGMSPGEIRGRVCSPDGRSWLSDAVVYTSLVNSDGVLYDTVVAYTDMDGRFTLEDLPGGVEYTVYVQQGAEILEEHEVYLGDGEAVELDEPDCFDPLEWDVAVVKGDYDDFEIVLTNLGFANYDVYDGLDEDEITSFLLDAERMGRYDVIFLNGGCLEEGVLYGDVEEAQAEAAVSNLREYVAAGGQLYVSDWAYDYVEAAWPDALEFVGEDAVFDDAQVGENGVVTAAVSDAELADWLDSNYMDIDYDLPVWPAVSSATDAVSVHLSGSVEVREGTSTYTLPAAPLLVSFTSGEGRVSFSTFRVAANSSTDMTLALQYMLYNL